MHITLTDLTPEGSRAARRDASPALRTWFASRFPAGEADYQSVLDALAAEGAAALALWLMMRLGPDPEGVLVSTSGGIENVFACGRLVCPQGVKASGHVYAAGGFIAAGDVSVAGALRAGLDILVFGHIDAEQDMHSRYGAIVATGAIRCGGNVTAQDAITSHLGLQADGGLVAAPIITVHGPVRARGVIDTRELLCPQRPAGSMRGAWRAIFPDIPPHAVGASVSPRPG